MQYRNFRINGVRDSKMLKEAEREKLFDRIDKWSEDWSLGHASNEECDELGMSAAQRVAARKLSTDWLKDQIVFY